MATSDFPVVITRGHEHSRGEEYTPSQVSGETFVKGDFVVWDDTNNWIERAGADPSAILGLSEVDSEEARLLTTNGKVPIKRLYPGVQLMMACATALTEAAHRGKEYGIARATSGNWLLDVGDTTNVRVVVDDVDETRNIAYVTPLAEFFTDGIDS